MRDLRTALFVKKKPALNQVAKQGIKQAKTFIGWSQRNHIYCRIPAIKALNMIGLILVSCEITTAYQACLQMTCQLMISPSRSRALKGNPCHPFATSFPMSSLQYLVNA